MKNLHEIDRHISTQLSDLEDLLKNVCFQNSVLLLENY